MEALQWAFEVRKIVQKMCIHWHTYVQKISLPTTKFKIGYLFFTNHYTIAAAKVSTESRLKNVAVTSFWLFEAMFLHKLHFFFNSS